MDSCYSQRSSFLAPTIQKDMNHFLGLRAWRLHLEHTCFPARNIQKGKNRFWVSALLALSFLHPCKAAWKAMLRRLSNGFLAWFKWRGSNQGNTLITVYGFHPMDSACDSVTRNWRVLNHALKPAGKFQWYGCTTPEGVWTPWGNWFVKPLMS